ncbi:DUF1902 domain-containing protein [Klebsiella michiganensis]|uniref:DUF1902 domain-containing protein n=1 Tax=Klebsiella michiganensis TaxID=1134687 RepID=UPI0018D2D678|nr:DUF1902 domain-containing protein [Klebsiella michiganensis]HBM3105864.1 DUF1902 domain-containing protein [Klebsiella oxytoca]MDU4135010.1 DUF1902 domain-containing protein [Klebsiella michiganensis]QPQ12498.1 DUF1902 domain-containing protein [Klebsiella michiganensis]UPI88697.1 DUF1902 domain-containing protein [Klebsiella michiganensis]HDX8821743.1 DUF1902 domain-containing protein [Klebsiella michiganensis]
MKNRAEFTVHVMKDKRIWIGECEELGLVTEATSFELLTRRVKDIAPELCRLNCDIRPEEMRLEFVQESSGTPFTVL